MKRRRSYGSITRILGNVIEQNNADEINIDDAVDYENMKEPVLKEETCIAVFSIPNGDCLSYRVNLRTGIGYVDNIVGSFICSLSGNDILKIIDEIAIRLGLKYNNLNDSSHIQLGFFRIRLAWLSLFKTGKTWYESKGYIPLDYEEYLYNKDILFKMNIFMNNENISLKSYMKNLILNKNYGEFNRMLELLRTSSNSQIFKAMEKSFLKMRKYYFGSIDDRSEIDIYEGCYDNYVDDIDYMDDMDDNNVDNYVDDDDYDDFVGDDVVI